MHVVNGCTCVNYVTLCSVGAIPCVREIWLFFSCPVGNVGWLIFSDRRWAYDTIRYDRRV